MCVFEGVCVCVSLSLSLARSFVQRHKQLCVRKYTHTHDPYTQLDKLRQKTREMEVREALRTDSTERLERDCTTYQASLSSLDKVRLYVYLYL